MNILDYTMTSCDLFYIIVSVLDIHCRSFELKNK